MKNTHVGKNHRLLMPAVASLVVAIGLAWGADACAQVVKGSGTTSTIPVWTGSTTIGNSIMSQSGGKINVSGGLVATTLSGNGSGVTNVNALTLGGLSPSAFAQLGASSNMFTGNISAASFSGSGSGLTNVNAATLGGLSPSAFAQLGVSNTFTMNQAINGNLTLGGSINNALTLQANLSDSSGDESANVIGGFGGSSGVPGNSVASGVVGATIAGGGGSSTVYGTVPNTVTADWGTVGGGGGNVAAFFSTVAGGQFNTVTGDYATVAGGAGNVASGANAVVPGGSGNTAAGNGSFAAGINATANNFGSFVWSDGSTGGILSDTGPNQFVGRASGGFTFYTDPTLLTGATLVAGSGSWSSLSDRNVKANFTAVDGQALLARLAALPIATWNYKAQPDSVRHMGPTAQDFREAFGLGEDEKHISTVDAQGVALAAIQALYEELNRALGEKDQQIAELRARLAHLEQQQ